MRHIVNVRKSVQTAPSYPIPRSIPAHAPFPDLKTNRNNVCQQQGQGAGPKRSVHAVRREAVTAQIQAFGSLLCAAQSRPGPGLRLLSTWLVYGGL